MAQQLRKVWMIKSNRCNKWFPIFNAYKHLVKNHCWIKYVVHQVISLEENGMIRLCLFEMSFRRSEFSSSCDFYSFPRSSEL